MLPNKRGSVFLLTLTMLAVVCVLGGAILFFTGEEDYSSAMSYESEVAFNLAESAIEEFVARLKYKFNNDDPSNQFYKVLRNANVDVSKEIPLNEDQVAGLTVYTREVARQIYGYKFDRGFSNSRDFSVTAVMNLNHILPTEAKLGDKFFFKYEADKMEKQGELTVTAKVNYKGHVAKIALTFMIRCVKTFVPPFNYFTLYVKDGTAMPSVGDSGVYSNFNTASSSYFGTDKYKQLRLDNGWRIYREFDNPIEGRGYEFWKKTLAETEISKILTPPGRVFLGANLEAYEQSQGALGVFVNSRNGAKLLMPDIDTNRSINMNIHAYDNAFQILDVNKKGMKEYVSKIMEVQGAKEKSGNIFSSIKDKFKNWADGWKDNCKISILNIGYGLEILDDKYHEMPSFSNSFISYDKFLGTLHKSENDYIKTLNPLTSMSGLRINGYVEPSSTEPEKAPYFKDFSPTLVYGPVWRGYLRASQIYPEGVNDPIQLPFVASLSFQMAKAEYPDLTEKKEMTALQAASMFKTAGVPASYVQHIVDNWDKFPSSLKEYDNYQDFMSNTGVEYYNHALRNICNRIEGNTDLAKEYDGPLKCFMEGALESCSQKASYPYGSIPKDMNVVLQRCPVREYYDGLLTYALPGEGADVPAFLTDFFFVVRSTEDFFRGRTTVPIGGVKYDRFVFKYLQDYRSGSPNMLLKLNGILTLNDLEPLVLRNLQYRGHGIIYSSPTMTMNQGCVRIEGDLVGEDTQEKLAENSMDNFNSTIGKNYLTIVAPKIEINTDKSQNHSRCYIEANLISLCEPLKIKGKVPVTIKGTVATPHLNLQEHMPDTVQENVIIYNPLNGIWRNTRKDLIDSMYVAKIVTGGVGKFDWKYYRNGDSDDDD